MKGNLNHQEALHYWGFCGTRLYLIDWEYHCVQNWGKLIQLSLDAAHGDQMVYTFSYHRMQIGFLCGDGSPTIHS